MSNVTVVGTGVGPEDLTEAHREAIEAGEVTSSEAGKYPEVVALGNKLESMWMAIKSEAGVIFSFQPLCCVACGKSNCIKAIISKVFFMLELKRA